ncbi:MAG: substrate-binding domain-containing protein [Planctomycetes bacterium]|nr:substrate-binding domain-containing protein [Planctomycetota bacterium]
MPARGPYNAKAVRIGRTLAEDLRRGRFPDGSYLPAESVLAAECGVARATIRRALALLERQRLVTRVPHRGVLVTGTTASAPPPRRRPATTRTIIAAVAASQPDEGLALMQSGIQDYAREHGFDFHLIASADDPDQPFVALDHSENLGIHGAIILPYPGPDHEDVVERLRARNFPLVCVERRAAAFQVPSVEVDNKTGMYRAVQHLLATHRRPVWYLGMTPGHKTDSDRYEGYRRAMIDGGYGAQIAERTVLHEWSTADPRYWHVSDPWRQGYEVAQRLLAAGDQFWSVACQKDYIAWGLYRACAERGLTIGHQVLVTGFDDLGFAAQLDPPLTTIRKPWRETGYKAAWLLDRAIHGGLSAPIQVTLPVDLIVRSSS